MVSNLHPPKVPNPIGQEITGKTNFSPSNQLSMFQWRQGSFYNESSFQHNVTNKEYSLCKLGAYLHIRLYNSRHLEYFK